MKIFRWCSLVFFIILLPFSNLITFGSESLLNSTKEINDGLYKKSKSTYITVFCEFLCPCFKKREIEEAHSLDQLPKKLLYGTLGNLSLRQDRIKCLINLPWDILLSISSYLNCFNVISLSHTSRSLRAIFSQTYWETKIKEKKYMVWDPSCPNLKIYLANFYYYEGFGIHPSLPDYQANNRSEIIHLPNIKFAKRAITLGFPKGQTMYHQALHLSNIDSIEKNMKIIDSETYWCSNNNFDAYL